MICKVLYWVSTKCAIFAYSEGVCRVRQNPEILCEMFVPWNCGTVAENWFNGLSALVSSERFILV